MYTVTMLITYKTVHLSF